MTDQQPARTPDRRLGRHITVILITKVAALWLLWFLFFSPDQRPVVNADAVDTRMFPAAPPAMHAAQLQYTRGWSTANGVVHASTTSMLAYTYTPCTRREICSVTACRATCCAVVKPMLIISSAENAATIRA